MKKPNTAKEALGRIVSYKVLNDKNEYQSAYDASCPSWDGKTAFRWAKACADHPNVNGRVIARAYDDNERVVYSSPYAQRGKKKKV